MTLADRFVEALDSARCSLSMDEMLQRLDSSNCLSVWRASDECQRRKLVSSQPCDRSLRDHQPRAGVCRQLASEPAGSSGGWPMKQVTLLADGLATADELEELRVQIQALTRQVESLGAESNSKGFLSVPEAAKYMGLSTSTLNTFRSNGGGPAFRKVGTRVVYQRGDLDSWMDDRTCANTIQGAQLNGQRG